MSTPRKRAEKAAPKEAEGTAETAAILAIGDEVLSGEVTNGNAAFLAERLTETGLSVREHDVVSDDPKAIAAAIARLQKEVDVLVVTGGLGPTEDDRTVDVVCELLGIEAEPHQASLDLMKKRFSAHGFEMTPNNLRQVRVPKGAEALPNGAGIAPGFRIKLDRTTGFFMPGVPREAERIFADHVRPQILKLREKLGAAAPVIRTWHVYGMGESHIDHRLAGILETIPEASLHFRTAAPENHVKVVLRSREPEKVKEALARVEAEVRRRIGPGIYGVDDDNFPRAVGRALREGQGTLALAESCTGGYAGQLVTSEPGSSDFFMGSVVAYNNDLKVKILGVKQTTLDEQGSVSELVAKEMAEGMKKLSGATVSVAVTGIAGSSRDGDTTTPVVAKAGEKPVGTVCFALAGPKSTKTASKFFAGGRERIRRAAAYFALDLARRHFI